MKGFNPALIPMQAQQNARMTTDAFADLASWTSSIKKKDEKIKDTTKIGNKVVDDIRSRRQRRKHVVKVDSDGSEIEESDHEEEEEMERLQQAEEYKNEGNDHFKNRRFQEAVDAYTMATSLDVSNAVYPANRAMANMKLDKYAEAEEDCTRALRHDPTYEKALFRRAQCRNLLGKLEGSQKDFIQLLKQNPNNKMAKKELKEINERLHQKVKWRFDRPANASKITSKRIPIKEMNQTDDIVDLTPKIDDEKKLIHDATQSSTDHHNSDHKTPVTIEGNLEKTRHITVEDSHQVDSVQTTTKTTEISVKPTEKTTEIILDDPMTDDANLPFNYQQPTNSFELERDWRSMTNYTAKSKYIRLCDTRVIAGLFAPQLPKFLVDICSTLLFDITAENSNSSRRLALELLTEISRVPRFKTALFFLLENEKRVIKELISTIKTTNFDTAEIERAYLH